MGEVLWSLTCVCLLCQTHSELSICGTVRLVLLPGTGLGTTLSSAVALGTSLCMLQASTFLWAGSIGSWGNILMKVRQGVVRCWLWTSMLSLWYLKDLVSGCFKTSSLLFDRCWIAQVCSAGRQRSLLSALLLCGDWSCQVLIWSHP